MLSLQTEETKEKLYLAVLALAGLLRFVNLGFKDMQAWDEAVYAVRAEGILRFGGWLDQTAFSIDGLYSSFHPPLYVWLTAGLFHLAGVSEFTARFFSAVFGALTLFVLYNLGKKTGNKEVGFIAALIFALNPFVSFFARQGQFDTALVFFISLAALLVVSLIDKPSSSRAIGAGLVIGLGLMTKAFVAGWILIAAAVWPLVMNKERDSTFWKMFSLMVLAAAVVALPWHAYMTVVHGDGNPLFLFQATGLMTRAMSGYEGNVKPTEVLYYLNQLFVLFPAAVLWFFYGLWNIVRERQGQWIFLLLWFGVYFIIFSVVRSKLIFYVLPVLPPLALVTAREVWRISQTGIERRLFVFLFGGTLFSTLWASSQLWRNTGKDILRHLFALTLPASSDWVSILPFLLWSLLTVIVSVALYHSAILELVQRRLPYLLLIPLFALSAYHIIFLDRNQHNDGGEELAQIVQNLGFENLVVAGYERNPQITYYFRGVDIGWREDLQFRRIIPPQDRTLFRSWLLEELAHEPKGTLLIIEKDKLVRYEVIDPLPFIPHGMERVFESRRYVCFQREAGIFLADGRVVQ